jgi:glucokinase
LLGDVGGTRVRWGWQAAPGDAPSRLGVYRSADFAGIAPSMRHYLAEQALPVPPACAIGIATALRGDAVRMTNHAWAFSAEALRAEMGFELLVLVNDFTALALALPALAPADLRQVGPGAAVAGAPVALIGPGTGLGVSGLLPWADGRGEVPMNGEGGHVTLAALDPLEQAVVTILQRRFGHASAERALSGPGLANLHAALCEIDGVAPAGLDAVAITAAALAGSDERCGRAVDLFLALLGTVAGNLALTLGARGGVYIGGGIVPRLGERVQASAFRRRFEAKGRFAGYLQAIPTFVVQAGTSPALLGAARALDVL